MDLDIRECKGDYSMAGIVLKVTLEGTHPPVWRRVIVPENMSFGDLHRVIQIVFGWEDAHLHIFEAPKNLYEIVASREDAFNDYLLEGRTPVSAIAKYEKWVRYVYDFGDEWKHKITFERVIDSYENSYATLMKASGSNFVEDSGGIWSDERMPSSYDAVAVNSRLERFQCREVSLPQNYQELLESKYAMKDAINEIKRSMQVYEKKLRKVKSSLKYESKDEASECLIEVTAWKEFCGEESAGAVCKMSARKTSRELFGRMNDEEKEAIVQLFVNEDDICSDKEYSDFLVEILEKHPEYYCVILEKDEIQQLIDFASYECNRKYELDKFLVVKGIMLGFWRIQIPEKTQAAYVFPALDYDEKIASIKSVDWGKMCLKTQDFLDKIRYILLAYGIIEQNALYEIFEKQWNTSLKKDEFIRCINAKSALSRKFKVLKWLPTGEWFVGLSDLDFNAILEKRQLYAENLPYKEFTHKELLNFDNGIVEVNGDISFIGIISREVYGFSVVEAEQFAVDIYLKILRGDGFNSIIEELEKNETENTLMENVGIWVAVIHAVMTIGLPALNGYSRMEYGNITGKNAFSLDVFDESILVDSVKSDTPLSCMPQSIQEKIYCARFERRGQDSVNELEKIRKDLKISNNELDTLIGVAYVDIEKFNKACNIFEDIADRTEDISVIEVIDTLCDRAQNVLENDFYMGDPFAGVEFEQTYRRETPKVGRNDPCPCGSGKKYKKCCGK